MFLQSDFNCELEGNEDGYLYWPFFKDLREADRDILLGRTQMFDSVEEMIKALKEKPKKSA